MSRVVWAQRAIDDVHNIRSYYSDISPDIGQKMIERIVLSTDLLLEFPSAGPSMGYGKWRKWRPRKTPCVIIYRPTRQGNAVARVWHAQQDWLGVPE
jgi:plasmid stabilization system protein ParE